MYPFDGGVDGNVCLVGLVTGVVGRFVGVVVFWNWFQCFKNRKWKANVSLLTDGISKGILGFG